MVRTEARRLLLFTASISALLALAQIYRFSVLELSPLKSNESFGDLRIILYWADCFKQAGDSVFQEFNPVIPCSGYIYGETLLLLLAHIGISVSWTNSIGFVFVLFIALMFANGSYQNRNRILILLLLLFSPPIALLVDRGNLDSFIGFIVLLSAVAYSKGYEATSLILISVSAIVKFYTIPLIVLVILLSKSNRTKFIGFIILLGSSTLILLTLSKIDTPFPNGYFAKFGFFVWTLYAEKLPIGANGNTKSWIAIVIVTSALNYAIFLLRHKASKLTWSIENLSRTQTLVIWTLAVHVSCFMLGMSYDYRLLFIIIATLGFLSDSQSNVSARERIAITSLLLTSCWMTFMIPYLAPLGDLALEGLTFWLVFRISSPLISSVRSGHARSL